MPLRNDCFISYRQQSAMARFVEGFCKDLGDELQLLGGLGIYRDTRRLQGGDLLEPELARGLCESACMIMIYTPGYFDHKHPFCAREYAAMQTLELRRLAPGSTHGLVIPIIVRDFQGLPAALRTQRVAHNFEDYYTLGKVKRNKSYGAAIRALASYISERRRELAGQETECADFRLPAEDQVTGLIEAHLVRQIGFPTNEGSYA